MKEILTQLWYLISRISPVPLLPTHQEIYRAQSLQRIMYSLTILVIHLFAICSLNCSLLIEKWALLYCIYFLIGAQLKVLLFQEYFNEICIAFQADMKQKIDIYGNV